MADWFVPRKITAEKVSQKNWFSIHELENSMTGVI